MKVSPWTDEITDFLVESNLIESVIIDPVWINYYAKNPDLPVTSEEMHHARNSVRAMLCGLAQCHGKMTLRTVLSIHALQMYNLLQQPGMFRYEDVTVGGDFCPNPKLVPYLIKDWIELYNSNKLPDALSLHYHFETIHPFVDGNGRVGRILWAMDLLRRGVKVFPILDQFHRQTRGFTGSRLVYYNKISAFRDSAKLDSRA